MRRTHRRGAPVVSCCTEPRSASKRKAEQPATTAAASKKATTATRPLPIVTAAEVADPNTSAVPTATRQKSVPVRSRKNRHSHPTGQDTVIPAATCVGENTTVPTIPLFPDFEQQDSNIIYTADPTRSEQTAPAIQNGQGFVPNVEHVASSDDESSDDSEEYPLQGIINGHTRDLLRGNGVPYYQPISTPIPSQIPKHLQKKIWANKYVDFAQLLPTDPLSVSQSNFTLQMDGSARISLVPNTKASKILSADTWTTAFLRFAVVYAARFPHETPALLKYAELVKDLALKRPGLAFLSYDAQFRMLRETVPLPWDRIHLEFWLMATTQPMVQSSHQPFRPSFRPAHYGPNQVKRSPTRFLENTCWRFNRRSQCRVPKCPHPHVCGYCRGPHPAQSCSLTSKEQSLPKQKQQQIHHVSHSVSQVNKPVRK